MNNRLKQFLAAENITQSQFADKIEVVRASVSHVLSGRNNPSYEFIKAIIANYPSLNIEWLMFGKGKMYKGAEEAPLSSARPETRAVTDLKETQEELLFNDLYSDEEPEVTPLVKSSSSKLPSSESPTSVILTDTLANTVQSTVKQRNVSKIIVLFDDGSYQEL